MKPQRFNFKVSDKENSMIITETNSFNALNHFITYFYGAVIYTRSVEIENLGKV